MKPSPFLLIPSAALLLAGCAAGPAGPRYGGPGYYGHDTVYVQGSDRSGYDHNGYNDDQTHRNVTDVNEVNVNRTDVNDRTVNQTNVNDRTVDRTNVKVAAVKKKATHKAVEKPATSQQAGQQAPG